MPDSAKTVDGLDKAATSLDALAVITHAGYQRIFWGQIAMIGVMSLGVVLAGVATWRADDAAEKSAAAAAKLEALLVVAKKTSETVEETSTRLEEAPRLEVVEPAASAAASTPVVVGVRVPTPKARPSHSAGAPPSPPASGVLIPLDLGAAVTTAASTGAGP
jgi:hypothetical protein